MAKTAYRPRAFLLLLPLCLALRADPARAAQSASASFLLAKAALDSCGERQVSASFSMDSALGELAVTTQAAAGFLSRSGLIPGYHYPGKITDVRVARCPGDQATISWTAPGNDGYADGTAARTYLVKISADPSLSPALSDQLFFSAADAPGVVPRPGVRGSTDSLRLTGLDPSVTYYLAIMALEADGTRGLRSEEGVVDVTLTSGINDFMVQTGFKVSLLAWNQEEDGALCHTGLYRLYRSPQPTGPFEYVTESTGSLFTDPDVLVGSTYYYRVAAVDGSGVEISYSPVDLVWVRTKPAMPPARYALNVAGGDVGLSWGGPISYDFGLGFEDPENPKYDELNAYRVWRSTSLFGGWTLLTTLSSSTVVYTDAGAGSGTLYYYKLTALNETETSWISLIRDTRGNGYMVTADNSAVVAIPEPAVPALSPGTSVAEAYWIRPSTGPAEGSERVVLKHVGLEVHDAMNRRVAFEFPQPASVRVGYGAGSGALQPSRRRVTPEHVSMYWHNGAKWTKLYGVADASAEMVTVQTVHLGRFEARSIERAGGFSFDSSGVSNRRITPNGDGLNDRVRFTFDNPADEQVSGRIFDLRGAFVADMVQTGQFTAEWDGKAGGGPVSGGVYIYQLECEGQVYNGTILVVR